MIGILIATHGDFSSEILKSAEMIVGKQENVITLSLHEGDDIEDFKVKLGENVERLDNGKGVIVLTDIFGGSPSNATLFNLNKQNIKSLTGLNLPMFLELLMLRKVDTDIQDLVNKSEKAGVDGIKNLNKEFSKLY